MNREAVTRELDELRAWWESDHAYYHTSKMARAARFHVTNIV